MVIGHGTDVQQFVTLKRMDDFNGKFSVAIFS